MTERDSGAWDVFISYASEDREAVAKPLALGLRAKGLHVWYDQFELELGDSLREKMDEGLAGCAFGVVILSERFFDKHFPRRELQGLTQREVEGGKVILPIWHRVTARRVGEFSPPLADLKAIKTSDGVEVIVDSIARRVRGHWLRSAGDSDDYPPVEFASLGRSSVRRSLDQFAPPVNLREVLKDW